MEPVETDNTEEMPVAHRDDELECAICFEAVLQSIELPCNCKICYCQRCWDRALAQSFHARGQARCPTCRGPVRVDFDASTCKLVFSRENALYTGEVLEDSSIEMARAVNSQHMVLERLIEQARPAQIRLLEQYGASHPVLREVAQSRKHGGLTNLSEADLRHHIQALGGTADDDLDTVALHKRLQDAAGSSLHLAVYWASSNLEAPKCVCGCFLQRVSGVERIHQFCQKLCPGHQPGSLQYEHFLSALLMHSPSGVICNLCQQPIGWSSSASTWTCENSDSTILHATAYDVCDGCFLLHTCGRSAAAQAPRIVAGQ